MPEDRAASPVIPLVGLPVSLGALRDLPSADDALVILPGLLPGALFEDDSHVGSFWTSLAVEFRD